MPLQPCISTIAGNGPLPGGRNCSALSCTASPPNSLSAGNSTHLTSSLAAGGAASSRSTARRADKSHRRIGTASVHAVLPHQLCLELDAEAGPFGHRNHSV